MHRYSYQASNEQSSDISGEIDASNVSEAVAELEKQGMLVRSIQIVPPEKVIADAEIAVFHHEIRRLLEQRSSWLPAIDAMALEMPTTHLRRRFESLRTNLHRIETPAQFLADPEAILFLPGFTRKFQSGSDSDRTPEWLASVSQQLEMRSQWQRTIAYPTLLLLISLVLLVLFLVFLFPVFDTLYGEMEISLPKITQFSSWMSKQVTVYPIRSITKFFLMGVATYSIVFFWRRFALTNRMLPTFFAGTSANLIAMSTLTSTLAELLTLKAPLPLSLSIAGRNCQHYYFERIALQVADDIRSGVTSLNESAASKRLPRLLIHALQLPASDDKKTALLHELSKIYSERASNRSDWLSAASPVFAIGGTGIVICFIVIALFLPMISMITTLSK